MNKKLYFLNFQKQIAKIASSDNAKIVWKNESSATLFKRLAVKIIEKIKFGKAITKKKKKKRTKITKREKTQRTPAGWSKIEYFK
jgi:uncharacterized protein (DUF2461 family)